MLAIGLSRDIRRLCQAKRASRTEYYYDALLIAIDSRKDKNTIESQIRDFRKAPMAAVWESLVCGVYDVDHWKFPESGHTWVNIEAYGTKF